MENKTIDKTVTRPSLFDGGWMNKFFNTPVDEFFNLGKVINVPAVNVSESDKQFTLAIAAPGMDKNDFKLDVYDDILTISAEKEKDKEEKNELYNRREYNYNSWSRSFTLPQNCEADKIDAGYVNGELKIVIPKLEIKKPKKGKRISVK